MRQLLLMSGILGGAVSIATQAEAQNYPWCANFADGAGTNCGFSSSEQCMATMMGSGGFCAQNNQYKPSAGAAPTRRQSRSRHARRAS